MLNNLKIAIIGGDARQIAVIEGFSKLGIKTDIIGFNCLERFFPDTNKINLDQLEWEKIDIFILPMLGIKSDGKVLAPFSSEDIYLTKEKIQKTKSSATFYSGIKGNGGDKFISALGKKLIPLGNTKELAISNSIPTAEGVLLLALQNTDFTIHNANVFVLGYGNCGKTIAHTFKNIGAKVKVGTKNSDELARLFVFGIHGFLLKTLINEVTSADIIINTIPSLVITEEIISNLKLHTIIIDIASGGGTDFEFAKIRGQKAILAPGLPAIVAPKTAGEIYMKALLKEVNK